MIEKRRKKKGTTQAKQRESKCGTDLGIRYRVKIWQSGKMEGLCKT